MEPPNGAVRCVVRCKTFLILFLECSIFVLDQNVTFSWIASGEDHNVNYIGTDHDARTRWENCDTTSTSVLKTPMTPNYVHNMTELGWNYFFCGLPDHCSEGFVKAKVFVVENLIDLKTKCPLHSY